jgi:uncharacterized protein (TIGR03067 family)
LQSPAGIGNGELLKSADRFDEAQITPEALMHTDIELLQGSWSITSLAIDGQEMRASMFAKAGIVVNANRFTSIGMGAEYEGTLEIDPSTNPRQLNMQFDVGPGKGNVNPCIYEIVGDVWRLCISTRGTVRPPAFVSTPGSGFAAEVLQRR